MYKDMISVERLITMLGCHRNDHRVIKLIDVLGNEVALFMDKDDGANDEYIEVKNHGFCLYFDACNLASIFLYSSKKDSSYSNYAFPLPSGLSFDQSKSDVFRILGNPSDSGGGKKGFFGQIPEWYKYNKGDYSLHLEFSGVDSTLNMVTLMPV